MRSVAASPPTITIAADPAERSNTDRMIVLAKSPHSANTSPWAKLMSWRIP